MKKIPTLIISGFILLVAGTLLAGSIRAKSSILVSREGLHWHPRLEIVIRGEHYEIPADIGIGLHYAGMQTYSPSMRMTAMHTHEPDGIIHLEFSGRATKDDLRLKNFFTIWGKSPDEFGLLASVTINGKATDRFLEHSLRDGDIIVMNYE